MIRFIRLDKQYKNLKDEILEITNTVYKSGQALDGFHTSNFETEIGLRTDRAYSIAVGSCSQALLITYLHYANERAKKDYKSSKMIAMPALSFIATAAAPSIAGWQPHFVDVDKNGLLDLDKLDLKRNDIKMLTYVNLFGNMIDYNKLKLVTDFFDSEVTIIEDAAQSFGAYYNGIPSGKLGHASCLSFDPTKNLPNYGSGGMILTDDAELMHFAKNFRDNGKYSSFETLGTNSKMSEVDCAQMSIKLKYFNEWQLRRTKIAEYYNDCLHPYVTIPEVSANSIHAWHKYVINTCDQLSLQDHLEERGIETKIHYESIMPETRAFAQGIVDWPIASGLSRTSLSLPIYPELEDSEVEHIVKSIQEFYD